MSCGFGMATAIAGGNIIVGRAARARKSCVSLSLHAAAPIATPKLGKIRGVSTPTLSAFAVARIDEATCIGCTLCIDACPYDAILGAAKHMHTVLPALCTGCKLCVPPCPVDCIAMVPAADAQWDRSRAQAARERAKARSIRLARDEAERAQRLSGYTAATPARGEPGRHATIEAAIERARARRTATKGPSGNSRRGQP